MDAERMTDEELEALIDAAGVRAVVTHVHRFRKTGRWWTCQVPGCNVVKIT